MHIHLAYRQRTYTYTTPNPTLNYIQRLRLGSLAETTCRSSSNSGSNGPSFNVLSKPPIHRNEFSDAYRDPRRLPWSLWSTLALFNTRAPQLIWVAVQIVKMAKMNSSSLIGEWIVEWRRLPSWLLSQGTFIVPRVLGSEVTRKEVTERCRMSFLGYCVNRPHWRIDLRMENPGSRESSIVSPKEKHKYSIQGYI